MKVRGERDSVDAKGPSNGPSQPMDIGATSIANDPVRAASKIGRAHV